MAWLTAKQALARLGTRPQTLYANVSRGRIRAKPDASDPRRSLYAAEDIERLAQRRPGRRTAEAVAAETMRWGDPVLPSAVSTIAGGRLFYRGRDALLLAETAGLEEVAALLWQAPSLSWQEEPADDPGGSSPSAAGGPLEAAFLLLARRAARDLPTLGRSERVLQREAAALLGELAEALLGPAGAGVSDEAGATPLHRRAAVAWGRPEAAEPIRQALVLLADHELNASTFATRVAASTGASLAAALLAGLATLSGPRHGNAAAAVQALAAEAGRLGAEAAVHRCIAEGRPLPAFGHRLYPDGDCRAAALLAAFEPPALYRRLREAGEAVVGEAPNVDFALAAMTAAWGLPRQAPLLLFALARSVGWLAQALEQIASGVLIRPRATYVGPALGDAGSGRLKP